MGTGEEASRSPERGRESEKERDGGLFPGKKEADVTTLNPPPQSLPPPKEVELQ